jgi:LPXTG-motif cell wall-anchored protein
MCGKESTMKRAFKMGLIAALCLALWPVFACAAPPAPKGNLVFEDDFSNTTKSKLEDNLQATDYSRGFHAPGVYHLKDLKDKTADWELFPDQSYATFSYQADLWDNSDDVSTGSIVEGLAFRATDDTHFYTVLVDPRAGKYAVQKWSGRTTSSELVAWTDSPAVKRRNEVNQVRVDGEGSKFTLYVNGEKLADFSDSAYTKGGIGLFASNVDAPGNHIHFDNIKVWSTEGVVKLPDTGEGDGAPLLLWLAFGLVLLAMGFGLRRVRN